MLFKWKRPQSPSITHTRRRDHIVYARDGKVYWVSVEMLQASL